MNADFDLPDEESTERWARRGARLLAVDPAPLVLYLEGELGAGKTSLARGMLRELGETGPVRSPTYGLVNEYITPRGRVVHIDLYRLRSPAELRALGLPDLIPGSALWLVEWPEKAGGAGLPAPDGVLHLAVNSQGRQLRVATVTARGERWLAGVCADSG
jgi:tRNA threonylcarbamoyladenosine biosynthesis protein TsaE